MITRIPLLLVILAGLPPTAARAQVESDGRWAVGVSFTPASTSHDTLPRPTLPWTGLLEGGEFTIGVGRGSTRGGDWGVRYVQKRFSDRSVGTTDTGFIPDFSYKIAATQTLRAVELRGIEVHVFAPFGTIMDRVQVGVGLAGGVARPRGTVEDTRQFEFTPVTPTGRSVSDTHVQRDEGTRPASDVLTRSCCCSRWRSKAP
jgi:hypothetical protein